MVRFIPKLSIILPQQALYRVSVFLVAEITYGFFCVCMCVSVLYVFFFLVEFSDMNRGVFLKRPSSYGALKRYSSKENVYSSERVYRNYFNK